MQFCARSRITFSNNFKKIYVRFMFFFSDQKTDVLKPIEIGTILICRFYSKYNKLYLLHITCILIVCYFDFIMEYIRYRYCKKSANKRIANIEALVIYVKYILLETYRKNFFLILRYKETIKIVFVKLTSCGCLYHIQ